MGVILAVCTIIMLSFSFVYICHANEFFHENCCDLFDAPDCIEDDAFYVVDSAGDRITLHRADF